ncbi:hypothetical protein [Streptomyces montanisoli]|uniref:Uncharacterized protein n=1 Tax=Streptomyces montanisoli TaxID=2798581 RepID=A0A940RT88_9ACTN|nr:hypothetical protein [Streptomyces montanisoli]MBP0456592.1 hypothetical protein [Streptomyces montanisoli]
MSSSRLQRQVTRRFQFFPCGTAPAVLITQEVRMKLTTKTTAEKSDEREVVVPGASCCCCGAVVRRRG